MNQEQELRLIETFDGTDWQGWLRMCIDAWNLDYGSAYGDAASGDITLVTGGWSDNEAVISAMRENTMGWLMTWQSSHRGGKHVFKAPEVQS